MQISMIQNIAVYPQHTRSHVQLCTVNIQHTRCHIYNSMQVAAIYQSKMVVLQVSTIHIIMPYRYKAVLDFKQYMLLECTFCLVGCTHYWAVLTY